MLQDVDRRQTLAWLEVLCAAPMTVLWALMSPAMAYVGFTRSGGEQIAMLALLAGGLAGWPALWSVLIPAALGRAPRPLGAWRAAGIATGVLACASFAVFVVTLPGFQERADAVTWLIVAGATVVVIVGAAELVAAEVRGVRLSPPPPTRSGST